MMMRNIFFWMALAAALVLPGCAKEQVKWEAYTPERMTEALQSGQPVLAYFYAAWCGSCYKLKDSTFSDPRVIESLEPVRRIKVDMSFSRSPKVQAIGNQFNLSGVPTVLLFDSQGAEAERYVGFVSSERLLSDLRKLP